MTPSDDRDPVDVLAEEFTDRLRRGEHPSVSDYAAAHPDHAEQLRELLPAVAQMEFLKRFRRAAGPAEKEHLPDRFGDFRIVRELGRGGMGVVFEAVQESLGRPVALKVLAAHAQLDPVRRERFVREAQAAARLHHTNIVPVFGVGEQDGLPYYVMQLIRGQGLHSVIGRWHQERGKPTAPPGSTVEFGKLDTHADKPAAAPNSPAAGGPRYGDWAFVAEVGMQAAEALHYAHRQGVLHRDVKPANLLLDPAGRVWVADFGLAKLVELHGLTASGDILGTLQYVAPECLSGDSDSRSDVYGLGATLYELLTLRPPYTSDSPARLVKQVTDAAPPPPRQLNPAIPHDLETIVLKAMAREPAQRYGSARELAQDLQAFLEDRPIKARRQSWLDRSVRWCRRNPTVAVLTASTAAALLLAAVVGWAAYVETKRALASEAARLEEANNAKDAADKARHDAEEASTKLAANLELSLKAFEKVFEAAGGNRLAFVMLGPPGPPGAPAGPGGPGGPPAGFLTWGRGFGGGGPPGKGGKEIAAGSEDQVAAVLEAVLAFYDKFTEQNRTEQNRTNPKFQLEVGKAIRRVGEMQVWRGQSEKAAQSFRRAADMLEPLSARYAADESFRLELALAYLRAPAGTFGPDLEARLLRTIDLVGDGPRNRPWWWVPGGLQVRLGDARRATGDRAGAAAAYQAAIAALTGVPREGRPEPYHIELAMARYGLARILFEDGKWPEARKLLEDSVRALSWWAENHGPLDPFIREVGSIPAYRLLAEVCDKAGDPKAARQARAEAERLAKLNEQRDGPFGDGGPKRDFPPKKKD